MPATALKTDELPSDPDEAQVRLEALRSQIETEREQHRATRIQRLTDEMDDLSRRNRQLAEENARLRGEKREGEADVRERAQREASQEVKRLQQRVERLKDEKQTLRMDLQEERLKRQFLRPGEMNVKGELMGVVKEHGGEVFSKILALLSAPEKPDGRQRAQRQLAGAQSGDGRAGTPPVRPPAPSQAPAQKTPAQSAPRENPPAEEVGLVSSDAPVGQPESRPGEKGESGREASGREAPQQNARRRRPAHGQPSGDGAASPQPEQPQPEQPQPGPAEVFVASVAQRAVAYVETGADDPERFRATVQTIRRQIEETTGWTPGAEAWARLAEVLIPEAVQRNVAVAVTANLLHVFVEDLSPMARAFISQPTPEALLRTAQEMFDVDLTGHESYATKAIDLVQLSM